MGCSENIRHRAGQPHTIRASYVVQGPFKARPGPSSIHQSKFYNETCYTRSALLAVASACSCFILPAVLERYKRVKIEVAKPAPPSAKSTYPANAPKRNAKDPGRSMPSLRASLCKVAARQSPQNIKHAARKRFSERTLRSAEAATLPAVPLASLK